MKDKLTLIGLLAIFLIIIAIAAPPSERTVRGTVFQQNEVEQAGTGVFVFINNTNTSLTTATQTSGPPNNEGSYSATLNASNGDVIYVRAMNETNWGYGYGIMGNTRVDIDVNLNMTRHSEAYVVILQPLNNTQHNSTAYFNLTANITILGNNGIDCNATLNFSTEDVFKLENSDTYIHQLGNLERGLTIQETWNLTGVLDGVCNISLTVLCRDDGIMLEDRYQDMTYNITSLDLTPPQIEIYSPSNNSRINNPVLFYYNVSDSSPVYNCSLALNQEIINVIILPEKDYKLNFTNNLSLKENKWEINCTDNTLSKNIGTSGLYNLSLNSYPFISLLSVDTPVNLLAGSNKTVYCNGTLYDGDSYIDILNVNASLFFNGLSPDSAQNRTNSYFNESCTLLNQGTNTEDFKCAFDVEYFANNGSWYCNVSITDSINSTNTSQDDIYINDLLAIGVLPAHLSYGDLQVLQISPVDEVINITNYGNIPLDVYAYAFNDTVNDGLSMDCEQGNIPHAYQRFSLNPYQDYTLMIPINDLDNQVFIDLNLNQKVYGAPQNSFDEIYWKLQIPFSSKGYCSGKLVFTAISTT